MVLDEKEDPAVSTEYKKQHIFFYFYEDFQSLIKQ